MELPIQIISNDKTVWSVTVQNLKDFNSHSFHLMDDDIVKLSMKIETLENKIGDCDQKLLEESKIKLLKKIDDEKRSNWILSRMKKQMNKQF